MYTKIDIHVAHTTEDNRHPMEGTKDSAGSRESFKKRNADEWTKGRQKKKKLKKQKQKAHLDELTLHGGAGR